MGVIENCRAALSEFAPYYKLAREPRVYGVKFGYEF